MLHTLKYENDLFNHVFSEIESQKRKRLEHYIKEVVNNKQIFFPGGTRFPPNFLLKKTFHTTLVIEQLGRNAFFRRGFATRLAEGLDKEFDSYTKLFKDGTPVSQLIIDSTSENAKGLPALLAVLLIEEALTTEIAKQILVATKLYEAPAVSTASAQITSSPEPMHRDALKQIVAASKRGTADTDEHSAEEESSAKDPVDPVNEKKSSEAEADRLEQDEDLDETHDDLSVKPVIVDVKIEESRASEARPAPLLSRPISHGPAKRVFDVEKTPSFRVSVPSISTARVALPSPTARFS